MARSRNIKPSFFTNDKLAEVDPLGRLLFAGLWTLADRRGRLEDRPKKIKAEILPYDSCDSNSLLNELVSGGFIVRYEANGTRFIQIVAFEKHQNPHVKEAESTIPAPGEHGASTGKTGTSHADSLNLIPDSPKQKPIASRDSRVPQVAWSEAGFQIPPLVKLGFNSAYPAADIDGEIAKAHAWVLANPKNRKSNWGRFLNSWLQKAQDKAPRVSGESDWRKDPRFVGAV